LIKIAAPTIGVLPQPLALDCSQSFGAENTTVKNYGNALTCIAFLAGMAHEELSKEELDKDEEAFPVSLA